MTAWQYKAVASKDFTDAKVREEINGTSMYVLCCDRNTDIVFALLMMGPRNEKHKSELLLTQRSRR